MVTIDVNDQQYKRNEHRMELNIRDRKTKERNEQQDQNDAIDALRNAIEANDDDPQNC